MILVLNLISMKMQINFLNSKIIIIFKNEIKNKQHNKIN